MNANTMLDMGGLAFLDGDPLGLRELDESLAWKANGPLPDWLEDADIDGDESRDFELPPAMNLRPPSLTSVPDVATLVVEQSPIPPPVAPPAVVELPEPPATEVTAPPYHFDEPAPPVIEPPLVAELVETGPPPPPPEGSNEGLVNINELLRFVEEPPAPSAAEATPEIALPPPEPVAPAVARRYLSFDELIDARICLLAVVADRLWAIPFDRVAQVASRAAGERAVDLFEMQEGKKRRDKGVTIGFDSDAAVIVDRILGPRSLSWQSLAADSDAPAWMLAQTKVAGENVGLLDWEYLMESRSGFPA